MKNMAHTKRRDNGDARARHDKDNETETRDARDAGGGQPEARGEGLRASPMMAHLLDALEAGTDIGHYGRLTFVMVARFFLDDEEMARRLAKQPDQSEEDIRALIAQVRAHDYNPPKRERILEWQAHQEFPICPDPDDPQACNVYRDLQFPDDVYDNIQEFWEERTEGHEGHERHAHHEDAKQAPPGVVKTNPA